MQMSYFDDVDVNPQAKDSKDSPFHKPALIGQMVKSVLIGLSMLENKMAIKELCR